MYLSPVMGLMVEELNDSHSLWHFNSGGAVGRLPSDGTLEICVSCTGCPLFDFRIALYA